MLPTLSHRVSLLARAGSAQPLPLHHRGLQQHAEACAYAFLTGDADPRLLERATECLAALAEQQGDSGLFRSGDNVESPPDSSFTVNGLARLVRVCRPHRATREPAEQALDVLRRSRPGLVTGGVHTPNHRWELAAALAQLADLLHDDRCGDRADEWLAEGVDLQDDGLFSERSPNYAAHVTDPCLLVLADLRDRADLVDAVHHNLHAQQLLTDSTGRVETLQSRRQDQSLDHFSIASFAWLHRVIAHRTGCGQCGSAALRGEELGGSDVLDAVAGALLDPELLTPPPTRAQTGRTGWTVLEPSGVAVHRSESTRLLVRAAPDVARTGRIASGVAANPTFAHLRVDSPTGDGPGVWLSSIRLSRAFFGLGPFRGRSLLLGHGRIALHETQAAAYYQPAQVELRYEFEGRFAAEMGFDARRQDLVTLTTEVAVTPRPQGMDLVVETSGAAVPHAVELGFGRTPFEVAGEAVALDDERWLVAGPVTLRCEDAVVRIVPEGHEPEAAWAAYDPGEAYTFLGATDAVGGRRLYVTTRSPGTLRISVSIEEDR